MPEPLAFLNGQLLPQSQASLSLSDAGFVFGATVTDFCRTFRQRLYLPERHLGRLIEGAARLGIRVSRSLDELVETAHHLVAHNAALLAPERELAMNCFITPGPLGYYSGTDDNGPPTLGMLTFPLPMGRYAGFFRDGVRLLTPSIRQIPRQSIEPSIKHRSRLHWWLASQEVHPHAADAVSLLLDEKGHVTETALANFLIVKDGTLLTPPSDSVLWGISLQIVEALCGKLGISFRQQSLPLADCRTASEAMICGSAFCVAGVSRINDHAIPWPGPVFERLLAAWSGEVGLNIRGQFFPAG